MSTPFPANATLPTSETDSNSRPGDLGADSDASSAKRWLLSVWNTVSAALGAVMGLLPHVLHHVGTFAGAFFVAGVAGNLIFGTAGLLLTIPLLLRLFRRFGTWKAPAIAVAVFAAMFSLSTFVLGPALTNGTTVPGPDPGTPAPTQTSPTDPAHDTHHP